MSKTQRTLTVRNRFGLHARPAAMVVETAARFRSEVTLVKDGMHANGKSIMSVMLLAAEAQSEVELFADGPDAEEVAQAIEQLFESGFEGSEPQLD